MIGAVERPIGDAFGVLADERSLASGNPYLVEVVPGFVAVVQADVDSVRIGSRNVKDDGAHAFGLSDVAGRRNFRGSRRSIGRGLIRRPHRVDVKVLVTARVLRVEDELRIAAPSIRRN